MKKIKICVAASEGGHLTEIAQLDEIFKQHDSFFVTEKTVLTEPLAQRKKVYFLKHINRRKFFFPLLFIVNTFTSLMILYRERPQLTVSTGALSVVPICIFSKIFGVKLIFIETYSRISSYTLTGKLLYYFSDLFIIQRPELKRFYPKSKVAGSIFWSMIFVTLGTQDFQFNRLLKEIDRLIDRQLIKEKVFAQIGHSSYTPEHYEFVHFIGEKEFDAMINDCSYVISHGGIGSIVMAIKKQKKVIAIPRLKKFKEHVDDHQLEIVSLFGKEGYVKGIADTTMLEQSIVDLAAFIPQPFKSGNAHIVQLIQSYITENFKWIWNK